MQAGNQISPMHGDILKSNVVGEPRSEAIRVPAYMRTGRPLAAPNFRVAVAQFLLCFIIFRAFL